MSAHGTRARYVGGCRCDECRAAESAYQRRRRSKRSAVPDPHQGAAKPKRSKLAVVPDPPNESPGDEPGRVEAAVAAEIALLSTAGKRPGLVAGALAMARMLDSPLNTAQHPQAAARLQAVLAELRIGAAARKSWLADVRNLTPPTSGAAG